MGEGDDMGIHHDPGKVAFWEALNSEISVDKTGMIPFLNTLVRTKRKYVSVSRPRRFGKTMAADSRSLFEGRVLSHTPGWDRYPGAFDVLRVVMTDFIGNDEPVARSVRRIGRTGGIPSGCPVRCG